MFHSTIVINNLIFFLIFSFFVYFSTIKFDLISNFFKIYDSPDKKRKFHKKKILKSIKREEKYKSNDFFRKHNQILYSKRYFAFIRR